MRHTTSTFNLSGGYSPPSLSPSFSLSPGGNQREQDRLKAQKKLAGQAKPKESASSLAKRKEAYVAPACPFSRISSLDPDHSSVPSATRMLSGLNRRYISLPHHRFCLDDPTYSTSTIESRGSKGRRCRRGRGDIGQEIRYTEGFLFILQFRGYFLVHSCVVRNTSLCDHIKFCRSGSG